MNIINTFRAKTGDTNAAKPLAHSPVKVRLQLGSEEIEYHGGLAVVSNRMAPDRQDAVETALKSLEAARKAAEKAALDAFDKAKKAAEAARDQAINAARSEFDRRAREVIINGTTGVSGNTNGDGK